MLLDKHFSAKSDYFQDKKKSPQNIISQGSRLAIACGSAKSGGE
jgi:hypothetical protein